MGRSDSKNEKDWLGQVGRADCKSKKDWLKKWEGLTQSRKGMIQKHGRSDSEKEGLVDTSQPLKIELLNLCLLLFMLQTF